MRTFQTPSKSAAPGFTLIEALVVVAILSIGLAFIAPRISIGSSSPRQTALSAADILRQARAQARVNGGETRVAFDLANRRILLDGRIAGRWDASLAVTVTSAESERNGDIFAVQFYPDGGSSGLVASFTQDERRQQLRVSWLTGAVDASN
jgi:general secretion pathway protein H